MPSGYVSNSSLSVDRADDELLRLLISGRPPHRPGIVNPVEAMPRPAASSGPTRTRRYAGGKVLAEDVPAAEAGAKLRDHPQGVLWLDLYDPDTADLQAVRADFGLHPLAVEDAVHDHQRPKLDRYPNHLFLNVYAIEMLTDRPEPAHGRRTLLVSQAPWLAVIGVPSPMIRTRKENR
jgi:Mg2+ and Co2+ transporter CorA